VSRAKKSYFKPTTAWYFTIPLIILGIFIGMGTETFIGTLPAPICGISDRLQQWTSFINAFFHLHLTAANAVLITTSLWFDLSCLILIERTIFGPSMRPYLSLFLFILLRQSMQLLVALPIPEGIIWHETGFPSLFVRYGISNDLYFSGHTGVSLLCAIELAHSGKRWLTILGYTLFAYMVWMVISFRVHYTMDVFTAVLAALFVTYLSKRWAPHVDNFLKRL
jgi:hypothetical protein